MKKEIVILSLIFCSLILLAACSKGDTLTSRNAVAAKDPSAVGSKEFSKAYKDNEEAASSKYDKKQVKLNGNFVKFDDVVLAESAIIMDGSDGGRSPWCDFDAADRPVIKTFKPGQEITVECYVEGVYGFDKIEMKHCKLL